MKFNEKIAEIKRQKEEYLIPENIRQGIEVMGVNGTMPSISEVNGSAQTDYTYVEGNYIYGETPDGQTEIDGYGGKLVFTPTCNYCARISQLSNYSTESDRYVLEIFRFDETGMHYSYDENNVLLKYRYTYEDFNFQHPDTYDQIHIENVFFSDGGFEGNDNKCLIGIMYNCTKSGSYSYYRYINIYTFTMSDNGIINLNEQLINYYNIGTEMQGGYNDVYNPHFVSNTTYVMAVGTSFNSAHYEYLFDLQKNSSNIYSFTKRNKTGSVNIDFGFMGSYSSIDGRYDIYLGRVQSYPRITRKNSNIW